ncbi:hypothetical protein CLHUN_26680 [Ruminiclostridium hungatei]|uniref:Uncharacterized protein n=1 Tax=Ruminiclostridium hungatei TaxID=48256 RepID=A0A1V4SJV7_RUMHU|nr:hypothetical protein [Ruminiclostridium hungatei]OPX43521.1 hypothetical protein CLHUN_26680 [Ruminiclostridium hungatei]
MEETLRLILEKLNSMDSDIKEIKSDVNGLKSDVNGLKSDVNGLKSDVNGLKSDVNGLKSDVRSLEKHVLIIENKQSEDSKALYDGYRQALENTLEIKKDIKAIKEILDVHEVKLLKVK